MGEITAKGHTGTVVFDGAFVTIQRTGALGRLSVGKGEKRIPLASITSVQWKPPGALVNGFIAFSTGGGNERRSKFGRQTFDAVQDENSVVVTKAQGAGFEALRAAIEAAIAVPVAPVAAALGGADEVARLAELHAAGHLSDAEYTAAKAKALGI